MNLGVLIHCVVCLSSFTSMVCCDVKLVLHKYLCSYLGFQRFLSPLTKIIRHDLLFLCKRHCQAAMDYALYIQTYGWYVLSLYHSLLPFKT